MISLLNAAEITVLKGISSFLSCPALDFFFSHITRLGDGGILWILLCLVLLLIPKTRRIGLTMAVAMLLCYLCGNRILKPLFARERPFQFDPSISLLISPPGEFSFPSGHSMNGFAAAVSLLFFSRRGGRAALLLAGIIAFSRLYLMVHYPSDVFCGILIGTAAAFSARRLLASLWRRREESP